MTTYISIGAGGADTWLESVATSGLLPAIGATGQVRLVRDTGSVVYWNGASWSAISAGAGAIDISDIVSIVDGSQGGVGELTEIISNSQTTATSGGVGATTVYGSAISINVTAGRWVINGVAGFTDNGALLSGSLDAGISNSATGIGLTIADIVSDDSLTGGAALTRSYPVPEVVVSLNATTTYYLNTKFSYSSGTPQHFGKLVARRVG